MGHGEQVAVNPVMSTQKVPASVSPLAASQSPSHSVYLDLHLGDTTAAHPRGPCLHCTAPPTFLQRALRQGREDVHTVTSVGV